jgi:hypothetical protein
MRAIVSAAATPGRPAFRRFRVTRRACHHVHPDRQGNRVYSIEFDVEGRLADAGQAGLRTVLRSWHWR